MKVRITDEFHSTFSVDCSSNQAVLNIVKMWLENKDSTPIYEILIEINDEGCEAT